MSDDPKPTIEEIEAAIPEDRKNLSFGGPGQDIIDVMEEMEAALAEPVAECEECDTVLPETDATVERVPGCEGPITLYFCPRCSDA